MAVLPKAFGKSCQTLTLLTCVFETSLIRNLAGGDDFT